jgi:signal transduction histidine kinase
MASLVRHDVERRGIAMTLDCPPRLPPVSGDSIQLQQVVLNLLVNACEAMSTVDGRRDLIVATRERAGVGIELTISDTGSGLKESEVERIFEPFVTTKTAGLGMGLSISRSIIEAHHGRIWLAPAGEAWVHDDGDAVPRGAEFHFTLPVRRRSP